MIAELVTTVARLALSPSVAAASASLSSRARRVSWISRRGARRSRSFARPGVPCDPNQMRPSTSSARPGIERLQAPLGAELEERVRLQAGLLGLAELAGAGSGLHAVERDRDEVVVGLVGRRLPRVGHGAAQGVLGRGGQRLDVVDGRDAVRALGGDVERDTETGQTAGGGVGARPVALGQLVAQVGERALRPGAEGDRLLDLEGERHPPVVDAAPVLDGHEREEAQQLLGAARGLLGRERRGGEPVEGADGRRARGQEGLAAGQRRAAQAGEAGLGARGRRRAPVLSRSARRGWRSSPRPAPRPRRGGPADRAPRPGRRRRAARATAPDRRRGGPWRRRRAPRPRAACPPAGAPRPPSRRRPVG